ncbi:H-NS histone [Pseudorhodoferax aquiterrae]|uniref:H-NS histone n=1 Tax=Pseudorhodoferax aquiterrae TaxID=747304 RepID=A0ABQ3G3X9_9BURK|nr:H-NS histone family protein [Pseudorhodoferax aquiterrae]GHC88215.1 H-NS histone [Pseudorhodoferax aquiterrae]
MARSKNVQSTEPTFAQLQQQIEDLKLKAEAVRRQEVTEVVERIRQAIEVYELTPEQLFGRAPKKRAAAEGTVVSKRKQKSSAAKAAKYRDPESGRTWTGNGKRPGWFVAAVEAGVDLKTLSV